LSKAQSANPNKFTDSPEALVASPKTPIKGPSGFSFFAQIYRADCYATLPK
jgi:hypothetical protein